MIDEAYIHYAQRPDMPRSVELSRRHRNLVILRTFSKIYGLAALRIGYAIADAAFIAAKEQTAYAVQHHRNRSRPAALAALDDLEHVKRSVEANATERSRVFAELVKMDLRPVPSQTSFHLHRRRFARSATL